MKPITFTDLDDEEHDLPTVYDVCSRCKGEGKHVNPGIDGHGITMDEWWGPDWDDESRDMYMSGGYDVTCYGCKGLRVVAVVDEDRLKRDDPELYRDWVRYEADEAAYERTCEMERRMGC
jgi:hypothetical protein